MWPIPRDEKLDAQYVRHKSFHRIFFSDAIIGIYENRNPNEVFTA